MIELSRRQKQQSIPIAIFSLVGIAILTVVIIVAINLINPGGVQEETSAEEQSSFESEENNDATYTREVSSDTQERLREGTILSFGGMDATTNVSIIADPNDLAWDGKIMDQDMLNAIDAGSIRLNLYPIASEESSKTGTESMVRVASCMIGSDENQNNATTLHRTIDASNVFSGQEDMTAMSESMGADPNMDCLGTAADAAVFTENNAQHFMTHFQLDNPGAVVINDKIVTNISVLHDDWLNMSLDGSSVEDIVL